MPEFEIQIKTTADLAGAKASLAMLEGQIEATRTLGKETADLEAKAGGLRSKINEAEIFGGLEDSAKKAKDATGELLEGRHGIHAIGHGLNEAMPGMMQFTRFLTSGFTAAIGAVVLAFAYLQGKLEDFKKTIEEMNTGPGARGEWAEKMADNTREASVEAAVFEEHLRNLVTAQERLTKSTETAIAAIHTQFSDANAVADQQKQLDLARLKLREALGQVTPEQAVQIRLQIDDAAFRRELEAKKAEIKAELDVRQGQYRANEDREPALRAAKEQADAAALAAKNAEDKNADKLRQEKEDLTKAQDSMEKSQARLLEPHHRGDRADTFIREQAEKNVEQQQGTIGQLTTAIHQQQSKQTPLAEAAAVAKEQAEKAKSDYEAAAKASEEIRQTVEKLQADLGAATARATALENIHTRTTAVSAQTAAIEQFHRVQSGHGTAQEMEDLQDQRVENAARAQSGSEASIGARDAVDKARFLEASLRGQSPQARSPGDLAQLHQLLDSMMGYLENRTVDHSQHGELADTVRDISSRLAALESQAGVARYGQ